MKKWLPYEQQTYFDIEAIYFEKFSFDLWNRLKDRFCHIIKPDDQDKFQEELKRFRSDFSTLQLTSISVPILKVWRNHQTKYPLLCKLSRT